MSGTLNKIAISSFVKYDFSLFFTVGRSILPTLFRAPIALISLLEEILKQLEL